MLLAVPVSISALKAAAAPELDEPTTGLTSAQWRAVAAVQEHLLPPEAGTPGAREVNALGFLRLVMADPRLDSKDRKLIEVGVVELEEACRALYSKTFVELGGKQREAALRRLEQSHSGRGWLFEMLEFLMEALLGDPSHGGNPGGVGWKWLGIAPGFPRPRVG